MRKYFLRVCTSAFIILLIISCATPEIELENDFEPFIIMAPGKMPVEKLPTEVISGIFNDLRKKGRDLDAENFTKTYDASSGVLVSYAREKYNSLLNVATNQNDPAKGRVNDFTFYNTAHVQGLGWIYYYPSVTLPPGGYYNSGVIGTTGQTRRLEAFTLSFNGDIGETGLASIQYQAHVQSIGWQGWQSNGGIAGTVGQARRIEAIRISTDDASYLRYRAHCQSLGWLSWVDNGNIAGTIGQARRLEAFEYEVYLYPY